MTEEEWISSSDPTPILDFLNGQASDRKLRLFGCAAVRLIWPCWTEEDLPSAVEASERYADDLVSKAALRRARHAVRDKRYGLEVDGLDASSLWVAYWLAETIATLNAYGSVVAELQRLSGILPVERPDWLAICHRLRCIFGNPFRPVVFDPRWRTETAVALATGIYEEQAFDRLPILADALEEAGCDHADVLNHCRGPGPHARGCWVVDLVLGKE